MKRRNSLVGLVAITAVGVLIASVAFKPNSNLPDLLPDLLTDVAVYPPQSLETVELIDHHKKPVSLDRFKNRWTFMFIGFTHCAHICVPTLSQMAVLKKAIEKQQSAVGAAPAFVFVSVDPERDTPEHLAAYMGNFDPEFVGMTGDETAVLDLEKRLQAFHRVREDKRKPQGYDIDHSGEIFLIDPLGRLAGKFHPPLDPNLVTAQFALFVSHFTRAEPTS